MTTTTRPNVPFVSVCLPVRNGAEFIGRQIRALADQDYAGRFEVIVADNASQDHTIGAVYSATPEGLALRVVDAGRGRGANVGRNVASAAAEGQFLAFCDHDDEVQTGWLTALVAAAKHGDVVCGVIDTERLNEPVVRSWKPDRDRDRLVVAHGMMPSIIGASCGVWAEVLTALGGFDESMHGGHDDVEFGWRAQIAGYRLAFAADAVVDYRYRDSITALARQTYARYRTAPRLVARYRPVIDQPATTSAGADRHVIGLVRDLPQALIDRRARGRWVYTASKGIGWAVGSIACRLSRPTVQPATVRADTTC